MTNEQYAYVWKTFLSILIFRKDVRLPVQLQRAMAAEAEAGREARAKVIAAEGELNASKALKEASDVMVNSPTALQVKKNIIPNLMLIFVNT